MSKTSINSKVPATSTSGHFGQTSCGDFRYDPTKGQTKATAVPLDNFVLSADITAAYPTRTTIDGGLIWAAGTKVGACLMSEPMDGFLAQQHDAINSYCVGMVGEGSQNVTAEGKSIYRFLDLTEQNCLGMVGNSPGQIVDALATFSAGSDGDGGGPDGEGGGPGGPGLRRDGNDETSGDKSNNGDPALDQAASAEEPFCELTGVEMTSKGRRMSGSPTDSGQCLLQILDDSTVQLEAVFAGSCLEHPAWEGPFSTGVGPSFEQQGKQERKERFSTPMKAPAFNFQKLLGLVTYAEQAPKPMVVTCTDHDGTTFKRLIEVYPSEAPQAVPLGTFDLPWKRLFKKFSNVTGANSDPNARAEGSLQAEAGWQARADHLCECPVKIVGSMTLLCVERKWEYDLLNLLPKPWALAVQGANGISSFLFRRKLITGRAFLEVVGKITVDAAVNVVFPQKEVKGTFGVTGAVKVDLGAELSGFEKVAKKGDEKSAVGSICFKGTSEVKFEAWLESGYPVRARCKLGWNGLTVSISASWNLDTWFSEDSQSTKATAGKVVASGAASAASGSKMLWERRLMEGETFFDIPVQVFPPAKPSAPASAGRSPAVQTSAWTHSNFMYGMGGM